MVRAENKYRLAEFVFSINEFSRFCIDRIFSEIILSVTSEILEKNPCQFM
jgi:hypothetical protein